MCGIYDFTEEGGRKSPYCIVGETEYLALDRPVLEPQLNHVVSYMAYTFAFLMCKMERVSHTSGHLVDMEEIFILFLLCISSPNLWTHDR